MALLDNKPFVREELPVPTPKTLKVVRSAYHATLFKIVYHEGGVVPKELRGTYSKRRFADKDISEFNLNKKPSKNLSRVKDRTNAKSKDESRI